MFNPELENFIKTMNQAKEGIPKKYMLDYHYTDGETIVMLGKPEVDDARHNCDQMGCGSFSHVMLRLKYSDFSKVMTFLAEQNK